MIDCSCFGPLGRSLLGWRTVVRNLVLIGLSLIPLFGEPSIGRDSLAEVLTAGLLVSLCCILSFTARDALRPIDEVYSLIMSNKRSVYE